MVYQVPPAKKSVGQNVFEFALDGVTYKLPLMKLMRPSDVALLDTGTTGIRAVFEKHAEGAFDAFETMEQLEDMTKAWAEESGISLGEFGASTGSSKSTARP